jgi:hypothetical protein
VFKIDRGGAKEKEATNPVKPYIMTLRLLEIDMETLT